MPSGATFRFALSAPERGGALNPATYHATITATGPDGATSRARTATFRVAATALESTRPGA
jgi:hypothetical protein